MRKVIIIATTLAALLGLALPAFAAPTEVTCTAIHLPPHEAGGNAHLEMTAGARREVRAEADSIHNLY